MAEHKVLQSKKSGLPPGSLVHVGSKSFDSKISYIDFTKNEITAVECKNIQECLSLKMSESVSWINIDGLGNIELIRSIGEAFEIDTLILEDILNTKHRPKMEEGDNYVFLTLKMLGISPDKKSVVSEQVSFILGKNWLISFQEHEGDIFHTLRSKLNDEKSSLRQQKIDFLFYRLIDTIVDNYFYVSEFFSDEIEKLEERVLVNPDDKSLYEIQSLKKQLNRFKKSATPLREAIMFLQKDSSELIKKNTVRHLRDVYDHLIQLNENIDTQKDMLASIMDLHMSGVSNKMNEIMKVLTIIATIFIPLTFIAGVYGMNFQYMPELQWKYGYYGFWGFMAIIFIVMIIYFKRKKWL